MRHLSTALSPQGGHTMHSLAIPSQVCSNPMQKLAYLATERIWLCLLELCPMSSALASAILVCGAWIASAQATLIVFISSILCPPEDGNVRGVMLPLQ